MTGKYRLGIDVGTNSIGWCVLDLGPDGRPCRLRDLGARIFSDGRNPKDGTSLAMQRRGPRQARRRRDRYLRRRADLVKALIRNGLMPADAAERKALEKLDPYELRGRGLDEALPLHHFGRALFHLDQRRGFQSNRRAERKADDAENKGMKGAIHELDRKIAESGSRTLGEYLYNSFRKGRTPRGSPDGTVAKTLPMRARRRGTGAKAVYDLYASRQMYRDEFARLWTAQAQHHPTLTDTLKDEIADIIFWQRPLKPVRPGRCTLEPTDERAPQALPSVQLFRMLKELANLRTIHPDQSSHPVAATDLQRILEPLRTQKKLIFNRMRRLLKLDSNIKFNLEDEKRDGLLGDQTGTRLAADAAFGKRWWGIDRANQDMIVERLLEEEDEARLIDWLMTECDLDRARAETVANTKLPEGHARFGRIAIGKMLPFMIQGDPEHEAARLADYHHSDFRDGEVFEQLPYYGEAVQRRVAFGTGDPADPIEKRFGRVANPTVHIGLNQLRKIVNALASEYGGPHEVIVELARELKLGKEQKDEIRKRQAEEQKRNDLFRAKLTELGQPDTGENRLRMRLWDELNPAEPHNRRCIYTGTQISINRLFSAEVEIEHILPFGRTLDNGPANKTVSMRWANRDKGNQSPFEAFGRVTHPKIDWQDILGRVELLPKNKRWRFAEDAMERFEGKGDFLARQLGETQHLAVLCREYLTKIAHPDRVSVTPGRLTGMLRGKWGLNHLLSDHNLKNRTDHRHHAIDAFVVAVTDRGLLQRVARAADQTRDRLIADMPEPWEGFREQLQERLATVAVSHKPDHGIQGALHEETAYGIVANPEAEGGSTLVYRKPIEQLNENEIERVRDRRIRTELQAIAKEVPGDKKALARELAGYAQRTGVQRIRLLKTEAKFIRLLNGAGDAYKAVIAGDNHHVDIIELPSGRWTGEGVTVFDANHSGYMPEWHKTNPGAVVVMRLHKSDLLKLDHDGRERIMRVVKLNPGSGRVFLAEHYESGKLEERHADRDDPFRWLIISFNQLKERSARKISVDAIGRVRDPEPPR